jgi:hypothetical protein
MNNLIDLDTIIIDNTTYYRCKFWPEFKTHEPEKCRNCMHSMEFVHCWVYSKDPNQNLCEEKIK